MTEVGAYEAKTHLPKLLDRVSKGERIKITRHGVVIALLVPSSDKTTSTPQDAVSKILEFRGKRRLGKSSPEIIKELVNEGRR